MRVGSFVTSFLSDLVDLVISLRLSIKVKSFVIFSFLESLIVLLRLDLIKVRSFVTFFLLDLVDLVEVESFVTFSSRIKLSLTTFASYIFLLYSIVIIFF